MCVNMAQAKGRPSVRRVILLLLILRKLELCVYIFKELVGLIDFDKFSIISIVCEWEFLLQNRTMDKKFYLNSRLYQILLTFLYNAVACFPI